MSQHTEEARDALVDLSDVSVDHLKEPGGSVIENVLLEVLDPSVSDDGHRGFDSRLRLPTAA